MRNIVSAETSVLLYEPVGGSPAASVTKEVVPAGTLACLRGYGMFQFPSGASSASTLYRTQADFMTTSDSSTPIFSDLCAEYLLTGPNFMIGPFVFIDIPGDGIRFEDGLFIKMSRTSPVVGHNTLLQVFYT